MVKQKYKSPQDKLDEWRKEVRELSDLQLFEELQKPTGYWREDVLRETLSRILGRLISNGN
jgi:hypothetical protein